ncbi:hypothetical protein Ddc_04026 [Ditylenchus destructor]|nr:hypothetical protein Ddc_04026 [Ditylenchus destructor]
MLEYVQEVLRVAEVTLPAGYCAQPVIILRGMIPVPNHYYFILRSQLVLLSFLLCLIHTTPIIIAAVNKKWLGGAKTQPATCRRRLFEDTFLRAD